MAAVALPSASLDPVPALRPAEAPEPKPQPVRPRFRRLVVFTGRIS